jgi:hypothetical protein
VFNPHRRTDVIGSRLTVYRLNECERGKRSRRPETPTNPGETPHRLVNAPTGSQRQQKESGAADQKHLATRGKPRTGYSMLRPVLTPTESGVAEGYVKTFSDGSQRLTQRSRRPETPSNPGETPHRPLDAPTGSHAALRPTQVSPMGLRELRRSRRSRNT